MTTRPPAVYSADGTDRYRSDKAAALLENSWGDAEVMEEITAKEAGAFSEAERQDFLRLVREGGEVGDAVLESNVRNAKCLVFLRSASALIGIAALKNPRQSYRQRIGTETGVEISAASIRHSCACRKLNPGILVMQSAQDWATKNVPGAIDGARDRRILYFM
jgi:hypothetical protein